MMYTEKYFAPLVCVVAHALLIEIAPKARSKTSARDCAVRPVEQLQDEFRG